jgi:hypothetical protein
MAKSKDDTDFDKLLAEVMKNPERLMSEELSAEQIMELQKKMNPYAYVAGDAGDATHKRAVAASYTNMRADYLQRFTMTSLVGYAFRMHREWDVPKELCKWTAAAARKKAVADCAAAKEKPYSAEELYDRAEGLLLVTKLAKDAAASAEIAQQRVSVLDEEIRDLELTGSTDTEMSALRARYSVLLTVADVELAKSRGLHYGAAAMMRKLGLACDNQIDELAQIARQHADARAIIDKDPVVRAPHGECAIGPSEVKHIAESFLKEIFEYNPDAHVRSAHDEFVLARSSSMVDVPGLGDVLSDECDPSRLPLSVVRATAPVPLAEDSDAVSALTAGSKIYNAALLLLRNETASAAMGAAIASPEKFLRYLCPISKDSPVRASVDVIPAQDGFHRWHYYTEVNYEELRTATDALYHEKPDLDWALILYEYFEGSPEKVDDAFEKFRNKHQDELVSDVRGIDFGGWTLLGDFKENRDKINFYNKHTDVLKRILDRHAEDKKIGQELMRNRVRQMKAKNIREDGPDAAGLNEYRTEMTGNSVGGMGAERVISREAMYRLERAKGSIKAAKELEVIDSCRQIIGDLTDAAKVRVLSVDEASRLKDAQSDIVRAQEMLEVPDDAIQVDVWSHDAKADTFGKSKFYTAAEAPDYIRDVQAQERGELPALAPYAQDLLDSEVESMTRQSNVAS